MEWSRLPLARATVDRAAHRRADPDLFATAWADPATQVTLVVGAQLATVDGADPSDPVVRLDLRRPADLAALAPRSVGGTADHLLIFLGEDGDPGATVTHLALVLDDVPAPAGGLEGFGQDDPVGAAVTWSRLRDVGDALGDRDAGLAVPAVGLAAWHRRHPRCPLCGAATLPTEGGWVRRCTVDASDHYPRTDPAVIMAVIDGAGRILLGHAAAWPERRFSTLAGYVEPGESLESAVRREVAEESGVVVGAVTYRGSQPWPFPASLMLAFTATATTTDVVVDGVEVTEARWFTRDELAAAVHDGTVLLPGATSVALALIEDWFGGQLPAP